MGKSEHQSSADSITNVKSAFNAGSLLKLIFSLSILSYVISRADWHEVWSSLESSRTEYQILFLCIISLTVFLSVIKWQVLLAAKGYNLPTRTLYVLYMLGQFYNQVLPTSVGGDVIRASKLKKRNIPLKISVSSIVVERLTGLSVLVILVLSSLVAYPQFREDTIFISAITICICAYLVLLVSILSPRSLKFAKSFLPRGPVLEKVFNKVENFRGQVAEYFLEFRAITLALLLSLLFHIGIMLNVALAVWSLGYEVPFWVFVLVVPFTQIISLLPISIHGIGLVEWTYTVTFAALGFSPTAGLAASLLIRARNIIWSSIGYLLFLRYERSSLRSDRQKTDELNTATC